MEPASILSGWESFYVIVGSSAAALTGLQFVVTVLGAEIRSRQSAHLTSAYATPTIVHFCAVLLNAAILSAPWRCISGAAIAIAPLAVLGVVYTLLVVRHARRQADYSPVLEDWIWHTVLPLLAYGANVASAIVLPTDPGPCLFVMGGTALLLLFVGIHNAWDGVNYIAERLRAQAQSEEESPPPPGKTAP